MQTWKIHIAGLVQGVGFRPYVCRVARQMNLHGTVSNTTDGVYIHFNANEELAAAFYNNIIENAPANAIITSHTFDQIGDKDYSSFEITQCSGDIEPDLLITPDIALCHHCRSEIADASNKRYKYPFITCLECGPRYSIISRLPYDRERTAMASLHMCDDCNKEYHDINNRRHFSQTNSCPHCSIPIHLYNSQGKISSDAEEILAIVCNAFKEGEIVAVKGMGGFLLLCDASNEHAVALLRKRKHRPAKPFAVMYATVDAASKDVFISEEEKEALQSKFAPIVLCRLKENTSVCRDIIAPGLNKLGVMLPSTGLLSLIAEQFAKPLIATSGNLSGSPIIYKDEDALMWLAEFADLILLYEREIVVPQDDSVIQFAPQSNQKIILRRSRGLAPNYYPHPFTRQDRILATGGELKSAFALLNKKNLYISQFLGDQDSYESQLSYNKTIDHLITMLQAKPNHIIVDKHPDYNVSHFGRSLADELNIPLTEVQHHKAHFAAVLAENDLLKTEEPVLGVVWDGTGFGDDEQIWGGEFFAFEDGNIERAAHLEYYLHLGDKMSKEPRLSALALCYRNEKHLKKVIQQFNEVEQDFLTKLLRQPVERLTSSMGRLLDGIASILNIQHFNTYEGEAAMKLEALAEQSLDKSLDYYPMPLLRNRIDWSTMLQEIFFDLEKNIAVSRIAFKVFVSHAQCIRQVARFYNINKIAFSGGVFQNALLVDLIHQTMHQDHQLYFHKQLSCNDECIGFGQIAEHYLSVSSTDYEISKSSFELNQPSCA